MRDSEMNTYANFPRAQPFHLLCPPPPGNGKNNSLIQDRPIEEGSEWVFTEGDLVDNAPSLASLRDSQSSPSEIGGDSGVCSEHDTPPSTRKKLGARFAMSSDSDNDSSLSEAISQDFIPSPPVTPSSASVTLERSDSNSSSSSAESRTKIAARKRIASRIIAAQSKQLPTSLLREIKEKSRELKKRRQALKETLDADSNTLKSSPIHTSSTPNFTSNSTSTPVDFISTQGDSISTPSASSTLASSRQKIGKGRVSHLHSHFKSLNQDASDLSYTESSSTSSSTSSPTSTPSHSPMTSAHPEEEDFFSSYGSDYYKKPLFECLDETAGSGFAGFNNIFAPQQEATIRSLKGTVRGVKNRVRAGIATFTSDHSLLKLYAEREKGKLIIYITTLGTVRETYERCLRLRKILWTLLVNFEERDVFMSRDVQIQLLDRLQTRKLSVPHVFLEGQYLGGVEFIEQLNESGELRKLLQPFKRPPGTTPCDTCGGFRMLPCSVCRGSKKSLHRNNFTLEFVALKCSACDESGLALCHECAKT